MKKSLRINLSDFINTELEKDVMYFIGFIFRTFDTHKTKIQLKLWYDKDEIDKKSLDKFKIIYDIFIKRYDVEIGPMVFHENVWYEIISTKRDIERFRHKFSNSYTTVEELITCIADFNTMLMFLITKDKRNVGKNKNSGYRVKTVAKPDKD